MKLNIDVLLQSPSKALYNARSWHQDETAVDKVCILFVLYNNNNNERISRALFHVKHAQLR